MEEQSYKKLRWKIIATTLSFSLVPLFALGLSMYYQFSVSYTAKILETLKNLTENRRNAIDLFLDERLSQLYTLTHTHAFNQLKDEDYLNKVFTLMQMRSKSYVDLGIIDREGFYASYVGPYELKGVNYKNEEWFHEVMLRGVYISDVFTGFRKFPHFIIAVSRREGERNWILRATIDTEIFDSMVKAAQVGQRGDAFVLNRESVLQSPPRFEGKLLEKLDYFHIPKFEGTRIEEMTVTGENNLYAMTWMRNKDWMLVIKESPREELMPLLQAKVLVAGLGLGGILLIVMGTIFVTRGMIARLIETDREKANLDAGLMQSSKMAALGKLAAGIAHEVNNPLAVIKEKVGWLTDLLAEEDVSGSENFQEFDDALKKIDYHVDRAKKVTHRLLGFARRMEPSQERVNINRILEETIDFLRNEAHYRNIQIHCDYALELPETTSDSTQLQQVFLNIFNNAIDAVARDGVINVQTTHYPKEKKVGICITDDGPGIPPDVLGKIFDPFFTTKEVGKGTGLGLAISYSIVEKLGGKIVVNSEVGKGTTFTILLPVLDQSEFTSPPRG